LLKRAVRNSTDYPETEYDEGDVRKQNKNREKGAFQTRSTPFS
jgi:hypothetical protein